MLPAPLPLPPSPSWQLLEGLDEFVQLADPSVVEIRLIQQVEVVVLFHRDILISRTLPHLLELLPNLVVLLLGLREHVLEGLEDVGITFHGLLLLLVSSSIKIPSLMTARYSTS